MYAKVQGKLDDLNQVMQENLAGVRVVKAFVRAAFEKTCFGMVNDGLMDQTIHAGRSVAVMIRYGRPGADDEEVIDAEEAAQAHDFILSFLDGYDTHAGSRAVFDEGKNQLRHRSSLEHNPRC